MRQDGEGYDGEGFNDEYDDEQRYDDEKGYNDTPPGDNTPAPGDEPTPEQLQKIMDTWKEGKITFQQMNMQLQMLDMVSLYYWLLYSNFLLCKNEFAK